jgi:hypothetical protein
MDRQTASAKCGTSAATNKYFRLNLQSAQAGRVTVLIKLVLTEFHGTRSSLSHSSVKVSQDEAPMSFIDELMYKVHVWALA